MSSRTAPARTRSLTPAPRTAAPRTSAPRSSAPLTAAPLAAAPLTAAPLAAAADPALDEALERISDLAARLWAVRSAHRPAASGWRRTSPRCAECGQALPCATLQAAG